MRSPLANGIYRLSYRAIFSATETCAHGLAILNQNQILGSDSEGGLFEGHIAPAADHGCCIVGSLSIPPGSELITGLRAGPEGLVLALEAHPMHGHHPHEFRVQIADHTIGVEVSYVGPLPRALCPPRKLAHQ